MSIAVSASENCMPGQAVAIAGGEDDEITVVDVIVVGLLFPLILFGSLAGCTQAPEPGDPGDDVDLDDEPGFDEDDGEDKPRRRQEREAGSSYFYCWKCKYERPAEDEEGAPHYCGTLNLEQRVNRPSCPSVSVWPGCTAIPEPAVNPPLCPKWP